MKLNWGLISLLGVSNHPLPVIQAYARVYYEFPTPRFQRLLAEAFASLNQLSFQLPFEDVQCLLEVGVAEGEDFIYLGEAELERLKKTLRGRVLPRLDFIIYANYRRSEGGRSLWGDLQRVRIIFPEENIAEIQVSHVKGTRRFPLNELLKQILSRIEVEAGKQSLPPPQTLTVKGR